MVKKIVLVAAVAVALVGAVVLSAQHYDNYRKAQTVAAQKAAKEAEAKAAATKERQQGFVAEFQRIQGECFRAQTAWNNVPAAIRARVPAPDCSLTKPIDL